MWVTLWFLTVVIVNGKYRIPTKNCSNKTSDAKLERSILERELVPYLWLGYIYHQYSAICTAFRIKHSFTQGQFWVTSAHCLYGTSRGRRTELSMNLDIYKLEGGIMELHLGDYIFHPQFEARNDDLDKKYDGADFDLAGLLYKEGDEIVEQEGGFVLDTCDWKGEHIPCKGQRPKTLTRLGYHFSLHSTGLESLKEGTMRELDWSNPRRLYYTSIYEFSGCTSTGSPMYLKTTEKSQDLYTVYAVNQDEVVEVDGNPHLCWEYETMLDHCSPDVLDDLDELDLFGDDLFGDTDTDTAIVCSNSTEERCDWKASRIDSTVLKFTKDGEARWTGDPHLFTFDGLAFDIYEDCTYRAVELPSSGLTILAKFYGHNNWRNSRSKSGYQTLTKSITWVSPKFMFQLNYRCGFHVFSRKFNYQPWVNVTTKVSILLSRNDYRYTFRATPAPITFSIRGDVMLIQSDFVSLQWTCRIHGEGLYGNFDIDVPYAKRHELVGLLGDYDGNKSNDCRRPNGVVWEECGKKFKDFNDNYENWVIEWKENENKYPCGQGDESFDGAITNIVRWEEYEVTDPKGFGCRASYEKFGGCFDDAVTLKSVINGCVVDSAPCHGDTKCIREFACRKLSALAIGCQSFVNNILDWRETLVTSCAVKCPSQQTFNPKSDSCASTCAGKSTNCLPVLTPQCECPNGLLLDHRNVCIRC